MDGVLKRQKRIMKQQRICIYAKDIQRITGKSLKTGHRILRQLRKQLGKQPHQFVSANEFARFAGLDEETVLKYLDN